MLSTSTDYILASVKKLIGMDPDYDEFDTDLIMHTNSAFAALTQIGAGPKEGFYISGDIESWDQFSTDNVLVSLAKTYLCLKVRLAFDPPASSVVSDSLKGALAEYEWRISVHVDPGKET